LPNPTQTDVLFTPGSIGSVEIPNRIMMPPMTTRAADAEGFVTEDLIAYGQKIKTVAKMAVVQVPTMKQLSAPFPTAPLQFTPQDPVFSSQILIPQQQLLVHRPVM
jgi:2,4-dienoyl-CoA reductase-like NADH-dependent reductase (Old Yellow Enzyme family)